MSSLAEARARLVCQLSVHHHSSKGAVQKLILHVQRRSCSQISSPTDLRNEAVMGPSCPPVACRV